jgi:shikimate dehydrogenase
VAADAPAQPLRFGVAGDPIAHSRSPQMHAAAYQEFGIDATYQRLPLSPPLFAETVRALPASGFKGINVTIPHKRAALELADSASPAAQTIGAANTLTFTDGKIDADNTDAPGMLAALPFDAKGKRALVLGAGGTARAAVFALTSTGADVSVWNRTASRAAQLAEEFGATHVEDIAIAAEADLIVHTTAAGMHSEDTPESTAAVLKLNFAELQNQPLIVDFVYRDGGSPLTLAAQQHGLVTIDGNELLVRQGALSFEIWFGRPAPLDAMRAALANSV